MTLSVSLMCSTCNSEQTTLGGARIDQGKTPSDNPYIQIAYYCANCAMVSFLNIVETVNGVKIA